MDSIKDMLRKECDDAWSKLRKVEEYERDKKKDKTERSFMEGLQEGYASGLSRASFLVERADGVALGPARELWNQLYEKLGVTELQDLLSGLSSVRDVLDSAGCYQDCIHSLYYYARAVLSEKVKKEKKDKE